MYVVSHVSVYDDNAGVKVTRHGEPDPLTVRIAISDEWHEVADLAMYETTARKLLDALSEALAVKVEEAA
jgi:hypothetical protein